MLWKAVSSTAYLAIHFQLEDQYKQMKTEIFQWSNLKLGLLHLHRNISETLHTEIVVKHMIDL